jgi:uncharacterized delta-60 repeat protein
LGSLTTSTPFLFPEYSGRTYLLGPVMRCIRWILLALPLVVGLVDLPSCAQAADASLDTGFGGTGSITLSADLPAGDAVAHGLALLSDAQGRTLALATVVDPFAFSALPENSLDLLIYRLNANGSLDTSFNFGQGYYLQNLDWLEIAAATLDSQGRIVLAGTKLSEPPSSVAALLALRLTSTGDRDPAFGSDGIVGSTFGNLADRATAIAVGANDDVYLGASLTGANPNWVAFKFSGVDGTGVSGWGNMFGFQVVDFQQGSSLDALAALAVLADQRLVMLGQACSSSASCRPAAARLTAAGALDATFCASAACIASSPTNIKNGRRIVRDLAVAGFNVASGEVTTGARTSSGALVFAGRLLSSDSGINARALVLRLAADGDVDATFGGAQNPGVQTLALSDAPLIASAIAFDTSARLVMTGTSQRAALRRIFVARLLTDGLPDTTFNSGSALAEYFPAPASDDRNAAGLLIGAGRISAIGDFAGPINRDAFVFRLGDVIFANGFE